MGLDSSIGSLPVGVPLQNKLTCVGPAFNIGSTTSVTSPSPANPVFSGGSALSGGGSTQTVVERALNITGGAGNVATVGSSGGGHTPVPTAASPPIATSAPVSVIPSRRKISHVQIHLLGPDNLVVPHPKSPMITSFAHPPDSHNVHQRPQCSAEASGSEHSVNPDQNRVSHFQTVGHRGPTSCSASGDAGGGGSSNERRGSMTIRIMPLTNGPAAPSTASLGTRSMMTTAPSLQQGASATTSGTCSVSGSGAEDAVSSSPLQPQQQQQQQEQQEQQQQHNGEVRKRSDVTTGSPRFQQYQQMLHPAVPLQHSPARSVFNLSSNEGKTT